MDSATKQRHCCSRQVTGPAWRPHCPCFPRRYGKKNLHGLFGQPNISNSKLYKDRKTLHLNEITDTGSRLTSLMAQMVKRMGQCNADLGIRQLPKRPLALLPNSPGFQCHRVGGKLIKCETLHSVLPLGHTQEMGDTFVTTIIITMTFTHQSMSGAGSLSPILAHLPSLTSIHRDQL